jgi:hypothetical protein
MQGIGDRDEIRRAAERDRQTARDRDEQAVDGVIDQGGPRSGRVEEAPAEGAQLAVGDRDALVRVPFREAGVRDPDGRSAPPARTVTTSV